MDPSEMSETVMNPETRTLKQIYMNEIEDEVKKSFITLMGEGAELKKKFIQENAWKANIDI